MPFLRFAVCRLAVLFTALVCLVALPPMQGQNLRFAAPMYGVGAVNSNAVANTVLFSPQGVAVDIAGNLYIADSGNRLVRKVDPTQTATIFAGAGKTSASGDGGPAFASRLTTPNSVAVDLAGNVYIADTSGFAVRKVDPQGTITTFAGGNGTGSTGNGGPATAAQLVPGYVAVDKAGNVYIADISSNTVRVVNAAGDIKLYAGGGVPASGNGDGGMATDAKLTPTALVLDKNGNLYVADAAASNVRKVAPDGTISTFAGTGVYGYSGDKGPATAAQMRSPAGVAVDDAGNVYIADSAARVIRMVDTSGTITTVVGTGIASPYPLDGLPADAAMIDSPRGLAVDPAGNYLYFTVPLWNFAYQVVLHPERFPMTRVGSTSQPQRLILENYGKTDISLTSINFTGDFSLAANYSAQASPCRTAFPVYAGFNGFCTLDVVFKPTAEGIRSFTLSLQTSDTPSTVATTLTSTGLAPALAVTSGQMYIVAGKHGGTPGYRGEGGSALQASLNGVNGIAVDSSGNLYLSEYPYCQIRKVDASTGVLTTIAGKDPDNCSIKQMSGDNGPAKDAYLTSPGPLAIDTHNYLYMADPFDSRIRRISLTDGTITTVAGKGLGLGYSSACGYSGDGQLATKAELCAPMGIAFDAAGNLYIADSLNNVIRKVDTSGMITTFAGVQSYTGSYSGDGGAALAAHFNRPYGVAVNAAGDVFVSDNNNHVIRKIDHVTGVITTVAGQNGVAGYGGDGGLAIYAKLNYPQGIAADAAGNIFVADYYNMVVRKIDPAGVITTVAGNNFIYDGYNGDYLPATSTWLAFPNQVAVSPSGYLFISDGSNQVVRELSPNGMLDFGLVDVNSTSAVKSVSMQNVGNMPLHFDTLFPTGITGDFAIASGGNCDFTAPLAVGESCSVNLTFTPTASGPRAGVFGFFDDGVGSPQYVALSGTGRAAASQNISFSRIPDHTYGDPSFNLTAIASSGLPVTFSVISGNAIVVGSTVTITGIGPVTIAADQAGDSSWPAAKQVTRSFNIVPAVLTVKADDKAGDAGQPIAPLTYGITGFVYSDTQSVVSGAALIETGATSSSSAGNYPITVSAGTLAAANYTFSFVSGSYSIGSARQTISFAPLPDRTYGDPSFALTATASSGLPVSFALLSGPATLAGGNTLSLNGVGQVIVQATQAGDAGHSAASPVMQSFKINPATLTVTAQNASVTYGQVLPPPSPTIAGYVYNESAAVVSGVPAITTSATATSPVGVYDIIPAQGTLAAANYVFTFVKGSLTITPATLAIRALSAQRPYGAPNPVFTGGVGAVQNGDQVNVTYSTTATITSPVGAYPITAAVSGASAGNYTPQVTQGTLTVVKADTAAVLTSSVSQVNAGGAVTLNVVVTSATSGTPTGSVTFLDGQTQVGSATLNSGAAALTVNALAAGVHAFTAVYGGDGNFNGSTAAMARVVAGDYTLVANPNTVNIKRGESGSTTITVTPTNGYKGTVTLACANLPAGVSCVFNPPSVTADGTNTPLTMQLTIATTAPPRAVQTTAASVIPLGTAGPTWLKMLTVFTFCLTLMLATPVIRPGRVKIVFVFVCLFLVAMLSGCGSSAPTSGATPLGAATISIGVDAGHKIDLTVNVQ